MRSQNLISLTRVDPVIHTDLADTHTNFKRYKGRASHYTGPVFFFAKLLPLHAERLRQHD